MKIEIEIDDSKSYINETITIPHGDGFISVTARSCEKCYGCGEAILSENYHSNNANHKLGRKFHLTCLRKQIKHTPHEKYGERERVKRFFARISRDKVIKSADIYNVISKFNHKWGYKNRLSDLECMGMYKGTFLAKEGDSLFDWRNFWSDIEKKKIVSPQLELAVLLFISGDKHAIIHSSRGNSAILRGRKKAHS